MGKAPPFFQELLFLLFSFYIKFIQSKKKKKKKLVLPDHDYSEFTNIVHAALSNYINAGSGVDEVVFNLKFNEKVKSGQFFLYCDIIALSFYFTE